MGADGPGARLRPLPVGALLEVGFRVMRRHWAVLLGLSFLLGSPAALLSAAASVPLGDALLRILPQTGAATPTGISDAQLRQLGDGLLLSVVGDIVAGILAAVVAIGCSTVVALDYRARRVTFGDTLAQALTHALTALGVALVMGLTQVGIVAAGGVGAVAMLLAFSPEGPGAGGPGVFLALIVGVATVLLVVLMSIRWTLAIPVVAVEGVGPIDALRRSWHLTRDSAWRTFGVLVLLAILVTVLGALLAQLLAVVIVDLLLGPAGLEVIGETLVSTLVALLLAPVTAVILTVYLFDQKVRRDRWDLPGS